MYVSPKTILIQKTADKAGITADLARRVIDSFIGAVHERIEDTGRVMVANLGIFTIEQGRARAGFNIATGERIAVPAKRRVRFTAARALKRLTGEQVGVAAEGAKR